MTHSPPRSSHRLRPAIAVVLGITMCVACGGPSGGGSPQTRGGGQLVWGKPGEADLLDPTTAGNATNWEILSLAYEGLVGLDDKLAVVPRLAASWRQTSPTTYVFEIRKGVKFSNGREMTTEDVVGSLRRLIDPKIAATWAAQVGIRDATTTGPNQVTVKLTAPRTSFLAALAATQASVLPIKELDAGTYDPKKQLLGTGPFKVNSHSHGESWVFGRNPYYWRNGLPKVDKLLIRIMPEDAARAAALRDGSIDVSTFENPDSIRLLRVANVKTVVQATTDYYRLDVNARSSIFKNDGLRQALALSIDRAKIKDVALGGVGRPTAATPVSFSGSCDPGKVPFAVPDARRARELVAAAGATGKTVEILTVSLVPMGAPIAQVLQQSLQSAGLKVRITPVQIGDTIKRAYSGTSADFDIVVSWFAGYADPAMVLNYWNPELGGFAKFWTKADPRLNSAIDKSTALAPGAQRTRYLNEACARIAQNANIIPLVTKDAIVAYRGDRVSAAVQPLEGYAVPLRHIAEFGVRR